MDNYTRALRNTFVADSIDRLHQNRGDAVWLEKALSAPASRFFLLVKDSIVLTSEASAISLSLPSGYRPGTGIPGSIRHSIGSCRRASVFRISLRGNAGL